MKKRLVLMFVAVLLCLGMAVGLTSCMKKDDYHTKSDVNSLISELKTEMETKIAGNETAIANLKAEYNEKIDTLKAENLANQESILNLTATYTNKVAELAAQDKLTSDALALLTVEYSKSLAALNKEDADNAAAIEALDKEYTDKVAELEAQDKLTADALAALTTKYEADLAALNKADEDNAAAIEALDKEYTDKVAELEAQDKLTADALAALTTKYEADLAALNKADADNKTAIEALDKEYTDKVAELTAQDKLISETLAALTTEYAKSLAILNKADADNKAAVEALDEKYAKEVANLKAIIADVQASIVAATNEYAAAVAVLNGKIEENNKKIDEEVAALEASIAALTDKHNSEIAELNGLIAELESVDAENADKIAELEGRVDILVTKYTVSFDLNGGSGNIPTQQVMRGDKVAKPEPPTREGYDFLGWYVEDEQWSFAGHVVTEDMTLTAKWKGRYIQYRVEYYMQHGAGYNLFYTLDKDGMVDSLVSADVLNYSGYVYNEEISNSTGCVTADGSLVLKIYYDINAWHTTLDGGVYGSLGLAVATDVVGNIVSSAETIIVNNGDIANPILILKQVTTGEGDEYLALFTSNATTSANGAVPTVYFKNDHIKDGSNKLESGSFYVIDIDIYTESEWIANLTIIPDNRKTPTTDGSFPFGSPINISEYLDNTAGWQHITYVGDISTNKAYIFVDGVLKGVAGYAYNTGYTTPDYGLYATGLRFQIAQNQTLDEGQMMGFRGISERVFVDNDAAGDIASAIAAGNLKGWVNNMVGFQRYEPLEPDGSSQTDVQKDWVNMQNVFRVDGDDAVYTTGGYNINTVTGVHTYVSKTAHGDSFVTIKGHNGVDNNSNTYLWISHMTQISYDDGAAQYLVYDLDAALLSTDNFMMMIVPRKDGMGMWGGKYPSFNEMLSNKIGEFQHLTIIVDIANNDTYVFANNTLICLNTENGFTSESNHVSFCENSEGWYIESFRLAMNSTGGISLDNFQCRHITGDAAVALQNALSDEEITDWDGNVYSAGYKLPQFGELAIINGVKYYDADSISAVLSDGDDIKTVVIAKPSTEVITVSCNAVINTNGFDVKLVYGEGVTATQTGTIITTVYTPSN